MVQMSWTFVNDSLCTTLCLQWEPEIIAIAVMHLAVKLSKFEVKDWANRTPRHSHWWDQFVEDLDTSDLEEICHQVLDLYTQPVTAAKAATVSPPPGAAPKTPSHQIPVTKQPKSKPKAQPAPQPKTRPQTPPPPPNAPPQPPGPPPVAPSVPPPGSAGFPIRPPGMPVPPPTGYMAYPPQGYPALPPGAAPPPGTLYPPPGGQFAYVPPPGYQGPPPPPTAHPPPPHHGSGSGSYHRGHSRF